MTDSDNADKIHDAAQAVGQNPDDRILRKKLETLIKASSDEDSEAARTYLRNQQRDAHNSGRTDAEKIYQKAADAITDIRNSEKTSALENNAARAPLAKLMEGVSHSEMTAPSSSTAAPGKQHAPSNANGLV